MPTISVFYGIMIKMWNEHAPPHFHALYGEHEVLIDIQALTAMAGRLPPRAMSLVLEWAQLLQAELMEDWALCEAMQMPKPISSPGVAMVPWRTTRLDVQPGFRLKLRFFDGTEGVLDLSEFVVSDLAGTVFERLKDEAYFRQACVEQGAVTWPGDIDMAPDAMYRDIVQGGGCHRVPALQRKAA